MYGGGSNLSHGNEMESLTTLLLSPKRMPSLFHSYIEYGKYRVPFKGTSINSVNVWSFLSNRLSSFFASIA